MDTTDSLAGDMKVVIVTGSRGWNVRDKINEQLSKHWPDLVIHGDCPTGADRIADDWCKRESVTCIPMPAQWNFQPDGRYDRSAGPTRNRHMMEVGATLKHHGHIVVVLAFPAKSGRGTQSAMQFARRMNLEMENHGFDQ